MPKATDKKTKKTIAKDIAKKETPKKRVVKKVTKKIVKKVIAQTPKKIAAKAPEKKVLKPAKIDLSIIIASLNTCDLTKQTIESVLDDSKDLGIEIIVVDNASTDGSVEMLEKFASKIKLVQNQRNLGFGTANDRGARIVQGQIFLFLNSDTLMPPGTLKQIIDFMHKYPEIGIASPKIVNNDATHSVQKGSFGKFFTPLRTILRLTTRSLKLASNKPFTLVDWVTGAAMIVRRDLFFHLNGFDENIFLYFEDQDLCLRAKRLDVDVAVINTCEIIHLCGKSSKNNKTKLKFYDSSQSYFMTKHFGLLWSGIVQFFRLPYRMMK